MNKKKRIINLVKQILVQKKYFQNNTDLSLVRPTSNIISIDMEFKIVHASI